VTRWTHLFDMEESVMRRQVKILASGRASLVRISSTVSSGNSTSLSLPSVWSQSPAFASSIKSLFLGPGTMMRLMSPDLMPSPVPSSPRPTSRSSTSPRLPSPSLSTLPPKTLARKRMILLMVC
jgi:hypothetical protein